MTTRRWTALLFAGVVLTLGVASASSLGPFADIAFSGFADARTPCTYDDVTLDTALIGGLTESIEGVLLTGLSGECVGTTPVVVLIGQDGVDSSDQILAVESYPDADLSGSTATLSVLDGDNLDLLTLDLTTVVTEVRVAFCPAGSTCT